MTTSAPIATHRVIRSSAHQGVLTVEVRCAGPRSSVVEFYRAQLSRYLAIIVQWSDGTDEVLIRFEAA